MIYLIFSKRDLIRGSFAIERLEDKLGYFATRQEAEAKADQLNIEAYENWAKTEEKHFTYAQEVRLYPELLTAWERELLRDSFAQAPELRVTLEDFRKSSSYVEYHVVTLDSQ